MIAAIRSEFRKIFSIRSTYIILILSFGLEVLFSFYATSYIAKPHDISGPNVLANEVTDAIGFLATLSALVGVMLVTHEYRYNTIVYTMTASRSRSQVLFAKIIAVSCFAIVFAAIFGMLSPALSALAFHIRGFHLTHQDFHVVNLLARAVFAGWGFAMLGLVLATIIRAQVGAIAAIFLVPGTVEQLLGLLLKKNQVYLPFTALSTVLNPRDLSSSISSLHAALIAGVYIVVGWLIAWQLFLRRDAN